jgi:hypothetical protein
LKPLIDLSKNGDAAATQVLLQVALTAAKAIEGLVVDAKPPIRYLSAIAPIWPVVHNASPHVPATIPPNLGVYSDGPLDLFRVFKMYTKSRQIMLRLLLLIHYLRQYCNAILFMKQSEEEAREWPGKVSTKLKVPGGDDGDVFEWVGYHQPMEMLTYQFNIRSLITSDFSALLDFLGLPAISPDFIVAHAEQCMALPENVDSSWKALADTILKELAGEDFSGSSTLHKLGKSHEGRKTNRDGKASRSTGDVCDAIRTMLNSAFSAICKNYDDVTD